MVELSRRLQSLLGAPWGALDAEHLGRLIGVQEDFDLDYKLTLYGASDSSKQDLALDVAKFANHQGGLLLLGVKEDADARAVDFPGVAMSDAEEIRMRGIIATSVFPHPAIDIRRIPGGATEGVYALYVPRSPLAPHLVRRGNSLKAPVRDGTGTRYLSESELADRYRARFAASGERTERLEQVRVEGAGALAVHRPDPNWGSGSWMICALVPGTPGEVPLGRVNQDRVDEWLRQQHGLLRGWHALGDPDMGRVSVGFRRFEYSDRRALAAPRSVMRHLELHVDGSGFAAFTLHDMSAGNKDEVLFSDESLVDAVTSALLVLSGYATDIAGVDGDAVATVAIARDNDLTAFLGHNRAGGNRYGAVQGRIPPAAHSVSLEDTSYPGKPLLIAARLFLNDLVSAFGVPEVLQINSLGELQQPFFNNTRWPELEPWAKTYGLLPSGTT